VHIIVHISTTGYRSSMLLNNIDQIATKVMQYKLNYVGQNNLTPQSSSGISAKKGRQGLRIRRKLEHLRPCGEVDARRMPRVEQAQGFV
jgi:hypothetical protein